MDSVKSLVINPIFWYSVLIIFGLTYMVIVVTQFLYGWYGTHSQVVIRAFYIICTSMFIICFIASLILAEKYKNNHDLEDRCFKNMRDAFILTGLSLYSFIETINSIKNDSKIT